MHSLQVSLTPELSEFVDRQVAVGGYQSPSDYISSLVAAKRLEVAREELEALLEEGVNSPSFPVTDEYWESLRARIAAQLKSEART